MPATIYYDDDADLALLEGRKVAVLGYGSQGHTHTLNLKDSGVDVRVGLREGSSSWAKAEEAGLRVRHHRAGVPGSRRDHGAAARHRAGPRVYREDIEPNLDERDSLAFAHGFNIHFGQIRPPKGVDVWMIAPEGPGSPRAPHLRRGWRRAGTRGGERGRDRQGEADRARVRACDRRDAAPAFSTPHSRRRRRPISSASRWCCAEVSWSSSRRATTRSWLRATKPESAYFETLHEVKLIVDLIYEGGITNMRYSISDTAEYGDMTRGPRIITDETRAEMQKILGEIQTGTFAQEWILENQAGRPVFNALRRQSAEHPIEEVGDRLRSMMPWIGAGRARPRDVSGG